MTFTARARSGTETHYEIEQDEDELPDSPEQQLASAVLLQAWSDANATLQTLKYSKGFGSPERAISSARRFLTAELPCPWARQRQLFTGALPVDDVAIRLRAVAVFGEGY
ncbi:MAG TPA: hypothetical protein ENI17_11125 [Pseudomonas xinjiangensis]|uniref:Uncharacterized protein n=2 Tax=root TaxID=1 RepID=A0A7V1BLI3_9GAMM|nr:hypothetical protein [Halopseudomonas xinjiangensis]HEC48163.1 hypothetical protein [Halopseudomonas xinjiangensis]